MRVYDTVYTFVCASIRMAEKEKERETEWEGEWE